MKLNGQKILVTGGAGFIGSHTVRQLLNAGASVTVFDNFSSGHRANLSEIEGDIKIVEGDILDSETLTRACKGADVICHQAAQLEITRCIETPIEDLRCNTEGTINVLEAARRNGVGKVVYASSACVYGQAQCVPQSEEHPTSPNWPYGISKLAAEHYARLYHDYYQIETIGLRYSIVYGPREWYGRVLTVFLQRALHGLAPVVWGGDQQRDFVYIDDVAFFNRLCTEADGLGCTVFNVSTGLGTSIRDLADRVCVTFDLGEPLYEQLAEGRTSDFVSGRMRLPAELQVMILDNRRARETLNWFPAVPLDQGMVSEMEWLRNQPWRWQEMHY